MRVNAKYKVSIIILFLFSVLELSGNNIIQNPDTSTNTGLLKTKLLAHRGGGNFNVQPNTYNAAKYGLKYADGIEIDIHISKDETIWLSHSNKLPKCNEAKQLCISSCSDLEIMQLDSCLRNDYNISQLESIFELAADSFSGKYISLDTKPWFPCSFIDINILRRMKKEAREIIRLTDKYNLQNCVMIESQVGSFLSYIKKHNNNIDCYLLSFGNFEKSVRKAQRKHLSGISINYNNIQSENVSVERIKALKKEGLKFQFWTINNSSHIQQAMRYAPDFIQTNNINKAR